MRSMAAFSNSRLCAKHGIRAGLILMYHRIDELQSDPWGLAVSPRHFAEHLEVLRYYAQPRSLIQMVNALRHQRLAKGKTVVVTFDDGYADNWYNAAPLLDRYEIPATVFLTSGYIGGDREFWWDTLEQILLGPETLPAELCLNAGPNTWEVSLGDARYYRQDSRQSDRIWRATKDGAASKRYEFYRTIYRALHPLNETERQTALNNLNAWAGIHMGARESHRCLSRDEVMSLKRLGLIELGAHTVTHPSLPAIPEGNQSEEIRNCKLELEQLLDQSVTNFAYPYGHYGAKTMALVREAGFSSACSTTPGVVNERSDLFNLPRIKVEDWDGEGMSRMLSKWLPLV